MISTSLKEDIAKLQIAPASRLKTAQARGNSKGKNLTENINLHKVVSLSTINNEKVNGAE